MLPLPGGVDNANRSAKIDGFRVQHRAVNHKEATKFDDLTLFWRLSKDEFLNFTLFYKQFKAMIKKTLFFKHRNVF